MNSQPKKIQPLRTSQVVALENLPTYQGFLIRRPKNIVAFKFSRHGIGYQFPRDSKKKAQATLLEALKHLKHPKKADLTGFQVHEFGLNKTLSESIYKKIAKVKSLSVMRFTYFPHKKTIIRAKWLKHFARLQDLNYGFSSDVYFPSAEDEGENERVFNDPLRYLKYCPKIQVMNLDLFGNCIENDPTPLTFGYFPTSIKHFSLVSSFNHHQLNLPLEKLQQLQSLNFKPYPYDWSHYMPALLNLPLLQNLELNIDPDSLNTWKKLTAKRQLKKLRLNLTSNFPTTLDIFDALKDCQLTHFYLGIHTSDSDLLLATSQCLGNQPQLQSLKLTISGSLTIKKAPGFPELCSQISNLEALRHLELSFDFPMREEIPSFQTIFAKKIELETLSLSCKQKDPSPVLKVLVSAIKESGSSLQRLKLDLPDLPKNNSLITILPSLENIKELELPDLHINDKKSLRNLIEAVETFKNLTELEIGQIGGTVTQSEYSQGIERILKKRGLRGFISRIEKFRDENIKVDVKGVLRKNPFLRDVRISGKYFRRNFKDEIYRWV